MIWQDYKQSQRYMNLSIGTLHEQYVLERKIQSDMISDFYKLSKDEFDTFIDWCNNNDKLLEIYLRKAIVRGFFGHADLQLLQPQEEK